MGSGNRAFYQFELGGREFEWDMATDSMLVGLDPQTGDGRWSLPGADYSCLGIIDLHGVHTDSTLVTCQINSGTAEANAQDDGTAKLGGIKNFEGNFVGIEQGLGQTVLCTMELDGVDAQRSGNDKDIANLLPATAVQSCDRDTRTKSDQLPLFAEFQRAGYQEGATVVLEGERA